MNNNNDTDIEGAESELLIFADHAYAKVEEFATDVTEGSGTSRWTSQTLTPTALPRSR